MCDRYVVQWFWSELTYRPRAYRARAQPSQSKGGSPVWLCCNCSCFPDTCNCSGAPRRARRGEHEPDPYAKFALGRTSLIFKDVTEEGDKSEEEGEEGEEGGEGDEGAEEERGVGEVRWFVPDGFQVAAEPETLDNTLIGSTIYMRWETFGWQLGKITDVITEATPRLFKKFNFCLVWARSGQTSLRGQPVFAFKTMRTTMHLVLFGADARLNSWVILEQSAA